MIAGPNVLVWRDAEEISTAFTPLNLISTGINFPFWMTETTTSSVLHSDQIKYTLRDKNYDNNEHNQLV